LWWDYSFNPLIQNYIRGTDHVAVVGIGGLGHMALQFLNSCGCEITAFSAMTNPAFSANSEKEKYARKLGAHNFLILVIPLQ
jgi:alcohol/geraniol dehydrogenase (NADP+)